jgi:hypothetical protein
MKKLLVIPLVIVLFSSTLSAQQTVRYVYSKEKVADKKVMYLKGDGNSFAVQQQEKVKPGVFRRAFTWNENSFQWSFESGKSSLLYKGDSVVAAAANQIFIKGTTYTLTRPDKRTYVYALNGKEIVKGEVMKNDGVYTLTISFREDDPANKEALETLAMYYGLTLIESKQGGGAQVLGFAVGFALGYTLTSAIF